MLSRVKSRNLQSGFSLVELMVVVAIIGILSSVSITNYQMFVNRARVRTLEATLVMANTVLQAYRDDNGIYPACNIVRDPADANYTACSSFTGSCAGFCNALPVIPPGTPTPTPACDTQNFVPTFIYYNIGGQSYKILLHCGGSLVEVAGSRYADPIRPGWGLAIFNDATGAGY